MSRAVVFLSLASFAAVSCGEPDPDALCPPGSSDPMCWSDRDGDGVPDVDDNCPDLANAGQADADKDGIGDACDTPPQPDSDGDKVPDATDNCPKVPNANQDDADKDGLGDACDAPPQLDSDGDKVPDATDNCPKVPNANQDDYNSDGVGDACTQQDGTLSRPFIITVANRHFAYTIRRDTASSPSDTVDLYPPSTADESGPEHFYAFRIKEASRVTAEVAAPEPTGVDIDVHLLESLSPLKLVQRHNLVIYASLNPGVHYLSLDSYKGMAGAYTLDLAVRPKTVTSAETFNTYLLKAVKELAATYGLLGYDSAVLTHDITYGSYGTVKATKPPRTMCVAAVMEVILTAMQLYAQDTKTSSVFDFLPKQSYDSLSSPNIRAHLWVNYTINSRGSADATRHFGLGMTVPFKELTPGALINLNRTTGTGHAVIFLAFIDITGKEYTTWSSNVIGFKYFSSQGGYSQGSGGLDYRYAIFSQYGSPPMPYKRDLNVIDSADQAYLNTGIIYAPSKWLATSWSSPVKNTADTPVIESIFDSVYFDGVTADDDLP